MGSKKNRKKGKRAAAAAAAAPSSTTPETIRLLEMTLLSAHYSVPSTFGENKVPGRFSTKVPASKADSLMKETGPPQKVDLFFGESDVTRNDTARGDPKKHHVVKVAYIAAATDDFAATLDALSSATENHVSLFLKDHIVWSGKNKYLHSVENMHAAFFETTCQFVVTGKTPTDVVHRLSMFIARTLLAGKNAKPTFTLRVEGFAGPGSPEAQHLTRLVGTFLHKLVPHYAGPNVAGTEFEFNQMVYDTINGIAALLPALPFVCARWVLGVAAGEKRKAFLDITKKYGEAFLGLVIMDVWSRTVFFPESADAFGATSLDVFLSACFFVPESDLFDTTETMFNEIYKNNVETQKADLALIKKHNSHGYAMLEKINDRLVAAARAVPSFAAPSNAAAAAALDEDPEVDPMDVVVVGSEDEEEEPVGAQQQLVGKVSTITSGEAASSRAAAAAAASEGGRKPNSGSFEGIVRLNCPIMIADDYNDREELFQKSFGEKRRPLFGEYYSAWMNVEEEEEEEEKESEEEESEEEKEESEGSMNNKPQLVAASKAIQKFATSNEAIDGVRFYAAINGLSNLLPRDPENVIEARPESNPPTVSSPLSVHNLWVAFFSHLANFYDEDGKRIGDTDGISPFTWRSPSVDKRVFVSLRTLHVPDADGPAGLPVHMFRVYLLASNVVALHMDVPSDNKIHNNTDLWDRGTFPFPEGRGVIHPNRKFYRGGRLFELDVMNDLRETNDAAAAVRVTTAADLNIIATGLGGGKGLTNALTEAYHDMAGPDGSEIVMLGVPELVESFWPLVPCVEILSTKLDENGRVRVQTARTNSIFSSSDPNPAKTNGKRAGMSGEEIVNLVNTLVDAERPFFVNCVNVPHAANFATLFKFYRDNSGRIVCVLVDARVVCTASIARLPLHNLIVENRTNPSDCGGVEFADPTSEPFFKACAKLFPGKPQQQQHRQQQQHPQSPAALAAAAAAAAEAPAAAAAEAPATAAAEAPATAAATEAPAAAATTEAPAAAAAEVPAFSKETQDVLAAVKRATKNCWTPEEQAEYDRIQEIMTSRGWHERPDILTIMDRYSELGRRRRESCDDEKRAQAEAAGAVVAAEAAKPSPATAAKMIPKAHDLSGPLAQMAIADKMTIVDNDQKKKRPSPESSPQHVKMARVDQHDVVVYGPAVDTTCFGV